MKTKLLCTFTDINSYTEEIESVKSYYEIVFNKLSNVIDKFNK